MFIYSMADFLKKFTSGGREARKEDTATLEKGGRPELPEKEKAAESVADLGQNRETPRPAPSQTPADEDKISTIEERSSQPQTKSERLRAIEDVLADGLR